MFLFTSKQEHFWRLNQLFGQWVDSNICLLASCVLVQYMFVIMYYFFSLVLQVCQVPSLPSKLFISFSFPLSSSVWKKADYGGTVPQTGWNVVSHICFSRQISALMDKFENQFETLDVQTAQMEDTIGSTTTLTTPQVMSPVLRAPLWSSSPSPPHLDFFLNDCSFCPKGEVDTLLHEMADEAG